MKARNSPGVNLLRPPSEIGLLLPDWRQEAQELARIALIGFESVVCVAAFRPR